MIAPTLPLPPAFDREDLRAMAEALEDAASVMREQAHTFRKGGDFGPVGKQLTRHARAVALVAEKLRGER